MIYLDNASTFYSKRQSTSTISHSFFNPSALYATELRTQIRAARQVIADSLGASVDEIYFTASATEANNTAIFGGTKNKKLSTVTSLGEHASVFEPITALATKGVKTHFTPLNSHASVIEDDFIAKASENCGFASLIHVSNETGAINDIARIVKQVRRKNKQIIFHSDGVQAYLKSGKSVADLGVDLYSISGHKIGAPVGIGALYIRKGVNIAPLMYGGSQERGMRPGTENAAAIIAFAETVKHYKNKFDLRYIEALRQVFLDEMCACTDSDTPCAAFPINAIHSPVVDAAHGVSLSIMQSVHTHPSIISLSITGIQAEILQRVLAENDYIYIGLGASCASSKRNNRILAASGKSQKEIVGSIRISFSINNTLEEVKIAANKIYIRIKELLNI